MDRPVCGETLKYFVISGVLGLGKTRYAVLNRSHSAWLKISKPLVLVDVLKQSHRAGLWRYGASDSTDNYVTVLTCGVTHPRLPHKGNDLTLPPPDVGVKVTADLAT